MNKILPQHIERKAYVYVRQSSQRQVEEHLESQDLQYQLTHRAQALGWPADQVVVIDDDLGKSAVTATEREGFQLLVAAVGLGQVGIILVTDVSRLARNCGDWYQLLDLASVCGTLRSDAGGVYDPRCYDDRLLLGLKGTFSEAQWYNMRTQLYTALLNKARRGELAIRLPIGYDRLEDGTVVWVPDREVQSVIRLVFDLFDRLGSAHAVLCYFRDNGLQVPRKVQTGPDAGDVYWERASYQAIYHILKQPAYAGAYTYGKQHRTRVPGAHMKVVTRTLAMEEWAVVIHDAFPGYITWDRYLRNQERLRENAMGAFWTRGTPGAGLGLLQGIAICGRCGRRLHTRYRRFPAYVCEATKHQYGERHCQRFSVSHVDPAIEALFFEAIEPAHLEAALAAMDEIEAQRAQLAGQWQQRLERARYEAELARRRYERVDPDNRLVAGELERRWEEKLQAWRQLEGEWQKAQTRELAPLSAADKETIRRLAEDVPALWHAQTTTMEERKRLLRCLIEDVTLDAFSRPGYSILHVRWHTGTIMTVEVERPGSGRRKAVEIIERVRELAEHHPDDQIADILNAEGVTNALGQEWNLGRVRSVRYKNKIETACPYVTSKPGPRGDGLIQSREAAEALGVSPFQIAEWFRFGWLVGHQREVGSPLWIRVTEEDRRRWTGEESLEPDMVAVGEAPAVLGISQEQVAAEVRAGRLLTYRIRIKKGWRWYVRVPAEQAIP